MMSNLRLRDRADGTVLLARGAGVVWRENGGHRPNDGADLIVHLLALGLIDDLSQRRTFLSIAGSRVGGYGHGGVLVQVVVVVSLRTDDGAGLPGLGEVDVGVGRRQDAVGSTNDRADLLVGRGHSDFEVEAIESLLLFFVRDSSPSMSLVER